MHSICARGSLWLKEGIQIKHKKKKKCNKLTACTCQCRRIWQLCNVIYKALCFDVAQGRMNGAPNETRTHSCRSASLAC